MATKAKSPSKRKKTKKGSAGSASRPESDDNMLRRDDLELDASALSMRPDSSSRSPAEPKRITGKPPRVNSRERTVEFAYRSSLSREADATIAKLQEEKAKLQDDLAQANSELKTLISGKLHLRRLCDAVTSGGCSPRLEELMQVFEISKLPDGKITCQTIPGAKEVPGLRRAIQNLQDENEKSASVISGQTKQIQELTAECTKLKAQLASTQAVGPSGTVASQQAEKIGDLTAENARLENQLASLRTANAIGASVLAPSAPSGTEHAVVTAQELQLESLRAQNNKLIHENQQLKHGEVSPEIAQLRETVRDLEARLATAQAKTSTAPSGTEQVVTAQELQLESLRAQNNKLIHENQQLKHGEVSPEIAQLRETVRDLEGRLATAQAKTTVMDQPESEKTVAVDNPSQAALLQREVRALQEQLGLPQVLPPGVVIDSVRVGCDTDAQTDAILAVDVALQTHVAVVTNSALQTETPTQANVEVQVGDNSEAQRAERTIVELRDELATLQAVDKQTKQVEAQLETASQRAGKLQRELSQSQFKSAERDTALQTELKNKSSQNDTLQAVVAEKTTELKTARITIGTLEDKLKILAEDKESHVSAMEEIQHTCKALALRVQQQASVLQQHAEHKSLLVAQQLSASAAMHAEEKASWMQKLLVQTEEAKQSQDNLHQQVMASNGRRQAYEAAENQLATARAEIKDLKQRVSVLVAEKKSQLEQLKAASEAAAAQEQKEAKHQKVSTDFADLRLRFSLEQKKAKTLEATHAKCGSTISSMQKSNADLRAQLKKRAAQLNASLQKSDKARATPTQEQTEQQVAISSTLLLLKEQLGVANEERAALRDGLDASEKELTTMVERENSLQHELEDAKRTIESVSARETQASSTLQEWRGQFFKLQAAAKMLRREQQRRQYELRVRDEEIDDLKQVVASVDSRATVTSQSRAHCATQTQTGGSRERQRRRLVHSNEFTVSGHDIAFVMGDFGSPTTMNESSLIKTMTKATQALAVRLAQDYLYAWRLKGARAC